MGGVPARHARATGHTGRVETSDPGTPVTSTRPAALRQRVHGIDMARGLAIIGMVMIHVGPQQAPGGGLVGAAYRSAHGRASILFIVLAGIGVSLLAGDRSRRRAAGASRRLWWRALILLPVGLYLQAQPTNVAVILQYYAVYFVVASLLLRLGDRALLAIAATSATLSPVLIVWLQQTVPAWFQPGVPQWHDVARIVRDILLTGFYPVATWTAPLAFGMWLGRRDLLGAGVARRMIAGGVLVAAAGFVVSDALIAVLGVAVSEADWRQLATIEPHNQMPLWLVTAAGIAVAVAGCCIVIGRRLPRVSWPLVAFGQLAFTVYVLHLLVLARWPDWLVRDDLVAAWLSVARFTIVSVALATAYRMVATRGPFELLLRWPWRRSARSPATGGQ
jgi:uncharacterized membrane protein YeiB